LQESEEEQEEEVLVEVVLGKREGKRGPEYHSLVVGRF
jgi:hypothetical protein